jgi:hypothetical protein
VRVLTEHFAPARRLTVVIRPNGNGAA